jgi:Sigma-70, region 4
MRGDDHSALVGDPGALGWPEQLSPEEARALTDQVKVVLTISHKVLSACYKGRADLALGYHSWEAYCEAEFSETRAVRLDRERRREIVTTLRAEGMSTRAIAQGLGVSDGTVRNDLAAQNYAADQTPVITGLDGRQHPAMQAVAQRGLALSAKDARNSYPILDWLADEQAVEVAATLDAADEGRRVELLEELSQRVTQQSLSKGIHQPPFGNQGKPRKGSGEEFLSLIGKAHGLLGNVAPEQLFDFPANERRVLAMQTREFGRICLALADELDLLARERQVQVQEQAPPKPAPTPPPAHEYDEDDPWGDFH